MDLEYHIAQNQKALYFKDNIKRLELIQQLQSLNITLKNHYFKDTIEINLEDFEKHKELIEQTALSLKPWRKGPFQINDLFIDSEWQSFMKYNLIEQHINIKNKVIADIGCNNGYYMFRMLDQLPKKIVGFDPGANFYLQFLFINSLLHTSIDFELLGVEHMPLYPLKFDLIFMLGVLYHRSDPIKTLKILANSLNHGGEIIIDTFMIDGEDAICLTPQNTYSKIPNIYFIPTITALKNWLIRSGFNEINIIDIVVTTPQEQRKTRWIDSQSLDDFLDPNDKTKTIEGYPAPKRVYLKAKKST